MVAHMSVDRTVTVAVVSPEDLQTHLDAISRLYEAVFSAPPFVWPEGESERHRDMMRRMVDKPDFGAALAFARRDLTGFAYGQALSVDTNWWEGFVERVPADMTMERPGRTFAVIDLAVREDQRRTGVGRRLMDTLLSTRREERATLAVQPQAAESHAFYAAVGGWELVGRQHVPNSGFVHDQFDIYVKALRSREVDAKP